MDKTKTFLHQSIVNYLNTLSKNKGSIDEDIVSVIGTSLGVKPNIASNSSKSSNDSNLPDLEKIFEAGLKVLYPDGLTPIKTSEHIPDNLKSNDKFNTFLSNVKKKGFFGDLAEDSAEYGERMKKVVSKFQAKFQSAPSDTEKQAESLKIEGNELLKAKEYEKAIEKYTKAIEISPTGKSTHIFYCNRAAAYQHLNQNDKAVEDCSLALALNSGYVKAHTRLAQIYTTLGNENEARKSAETALKLDPENSIAKSIIGDSVDTTPKAPAFGGMPNLGGMDFGAMMNNPMVKQMAEQMSKNPDMMSNMANMMSGLTGGSGGMPDLAGMMSGAGGGMPNLSEMMQNPNIKAMAEKMSKDPNMMETMGKMMGGFKKPDDDNTPV